MCWGNWGFRLPALARWGNLLHLWCAIATGSSSIHRRYRYQVRFSIALALSLSFLVVCDWLGVCFESGSVCFIVLLCCHCLLLYGILIFVVVSHSFVLNIFVSGLGLCACFVDVGVVCLKVVVPFLFVDPRCVVSNILCHIKCVCGLCLQFSFISARYHLFEKVVCNVWWQFRSCGPPWWTF